MADKDWAWDWAGHSNLGTIEFGKVAKMAQSVNDYAQYEKLKKKFENYNPKEKYGIE